MELSGLELRYVVNQLSNSLKSGYYVSSINSVTKTSFLFRLHHPTEKELILMISTQGLWLTKLKFQSLEESVLLDIFKRDLERSKIDSIEQIDTERIVMIKFRSLEDKHNILILEFFRDGNLILCDDQLQIVSIMNPVEVRHRTLKIGLRYSPPPSRGIDVFNVDLGSLMSLKEKAQGDLDVSRWIGRNMSLPKKFAEEIVHSSNVDNKKVVDLSDADISSIYKNLKDLVINVSSGSNHSPIVISDAAGTDLEAFPIFSTDTSKFSTNEKIIKRVPTYMDALDLVFSNTIVNRGKSTQTGEIDRQVASLEHDIAEQDRAKELVILKASEIRALASALMGYSHHQLTESDSLENLLGSMSASIISSKGIKYIKVVEELVPLEANVAKTASSLFVRAKEMERGGLSIDDAKDRLQQRINKLKNQAESIHRKHNFVRRQREREWYERYRWFISSDGLLAIGGRDASSNSAIIRKYLTEQDLVFHAEVHGSPFFILKNGRASSPQSTLLQVAQATVSYSRAWKDGLSSADSYWVTSEQVKKGAPSGQYLPKGSFVIEGKRNYIKGNEIRLAAGIMPLDNKYLFVCGPVEAISKRSLLYVALLPGGYDPMEISKKIRIDLYNSAIESKDVNYNEEVASFIKSISHDEIIMALPGGRSKISQVRWGEGKALADLESRVDK
jgi:predicted ribosome quality control (RQC) complex YloA/Tae2 family protein